MTTASTVGEEEAALKAQLAALQKTKHSRQLLEALDGGFLPQGTRLVHPSDHEVGRVIVFTPEEAATLVDPIRKIVAARNQEQAK
jgi:hypothetical protein